jgi:ABC-type multidrug transport system fused ATPase/permease subunit
MLIDIFRLFSVFIKYLSKRSIFKVTLFLTTSIFSSILEMFTVIVTLPFLTNLLSPNTENKYSDLLIDLEKYLPLHFKNQSNFFFFVFISVMLLSLIFKIIVSYMQANTSIMIANDFAIKSYEGLISQPLEDFHKMNYGTIQAFFSRIFEISNTLLNPIIIIIQSIILLALTIGALLVLEPFVTLTVFLSIIIFYIIIALFINKKLKFYGNSFNNSQININTHLFESHNAFKLISLDNLKAPFIKDFSKKSREYIKSISYNAYYSTLTRPIIETLTILVILLFYFTTNGKINNFNFAFIGTLFFAAQRIIPALQQVYSQYASIIGRYESVKDAFEILEKFSINDNVDPTDRKFIEFNRHLKFTNVSFKYSSKSNFLFKNAFIEIKKGEKVGIFGPSGVGKSSFIDLLIGFYHPNEGEIKIDDCILNRNNITSWRSKISFVPQKIFIANASVYENIAFGIPFSEIDLQRVEICIEISLLKSFVKSLSNGYDTILSESGLSISGGQAQRIGIARALYKSSEILILDEATSALDYETEKDILNNIKLYFPSLTIINIAHRLTSLCKSDVLLSFESNSIREVRNKQEIELITA